ncbi:hypothetical protein [Pseudoduganella aquatica]|uniref:hypothetical protein n=1 Tax=Pseudoduganella aquatica TaxID=2660641 RepID=UPI001CB6FF95|nr:hypothetical protein [Pseudoduganella aquatica]
MRKILTVLPPLLLPLLLTGCARDSATYYVEGANNSHTLSLRREQDYFWNDNVRLTLVATRMPDCQRQIPMGEMLLDEVDVEVFSSPDNFWSLRSGDQVWQVETQNCALVSENGPATGTKVGEFKVVDNKLVFEPAVAAPAPAPAAPAAPQAPAPAPAPAN